MITDSLRTLVSDARNLLATLAPDAISGRDAGVLVESFAELERIAVAGRTLAGRRAEQAAVWRDQGYRSPAQWMAVRAQSTMGAAIATLETGRKLEQLPATREAFTAGELSAHQAQEIASAASVDPRSESTLLEAAQVETMARLRERCGEIVASAGRDDDHDERLHRSRYLRHWTDPDGAVRLDARLTPDAGARLLPVVEEQARALLHQARRAGSPERREAYAADALVSLAGGSSAVLPVVHVHVDKPAWDRGRTIPGESCRVAGLGPVSVATARRLAGDGMVKAVLHEGADVRSVAHFGRTIPARIRTALEARDEHCVVPGCEQREGLEIDHLIPFAEGGPTSLENLVRLCRYHHAMKTHRGWQLAGTPGSWRWLRPDRGGGRAPPKTA